MKSQFLLILGLLTAVPAAAQDGAALYRRDCAGCHDMGVDSRARPRSAADDDRRARVERARERTDAVDGQPRDGRRTPRHRAVRRRQIAVRARSLTTTPPSSSMCTRARELHEPAPTGPVGNGWGENTHNTRFQSGPSAIPAAAVPRLKVLKWAVRISRRHRRERSAHHRRRARVRRQPGRQGVLAQRRIRVHPLVFSRRRARCAVQSRLAKSRRGNGPAYMAFFGDLSGNVYALNATTGALVWTMRPDAHPLSRIMGSVVYHSGRLYVPIASGERNSLGAPSSYECCRSPRQHHRAQRAQRQTGLEKPTRLRTKRSRRRRMRSARRCGGRQARACGAVRPSTRSATGCTSRRATTTARRRRARATRS